MICACIDIGSNTTRLLVAEPGEEGVRELLRQRAFTRIGKVMRGGDTIPATTIDEVVAIVEAQVRLARELGCQTIRAVATAAIRDALNRAQLTRAITDQTGIQVSVLTGEEEARLAFAGATNTLENPPVGDIAVIDVGGASSEIAIGTMATGVRASSSFRIGSGMLADTYLHDDPPTAAQLRRLREHVDGTFDGYSLPSPELAVAVGGSAGSLRRLVGGVLDHDSLERGLGVLADGPSTDVGRALNIDPERVPLLAGSIVILDAISRRLDRPVLVGNGGLREGVILEILMDGGARGHSR